MKYRINPDESIVHEDEWSEHYPENHSGDFAEVELPDEMETLIDFMVDNLSNHTLMTFSKLLKERGNSHVHTLISLLIEERINITAPCKVCGESNDMVYFDRSLGYNICEKCDED